MKNIKFILVALVAAFVTLGFTNVYAQEDGNRDESGHVVKGPYLTNEFGDNWFISFGGGATTFVGRDVAGIKVAPVTEITAGKWFVPSVGAQFGYSGYQNRINNSLNRPAFGDLNGIYGFHYVHGDILWNISNAVSGYKETRFWDIVPYVTSGVLVNVSENKVAKMKYAHEFAGGFGVISDFRLEETVGLYVKVGVLASQKSRMVAGVSGPGFSPAATVGLIISLSSKKNFDRYSSVATVPVVYPFTEQDYYNLKNKSDYLELENKALRKNIDECMNRQKDTVVIKETITEITPISLYFEIGKATLSENELAHFYDYFVSAVGDDDGVDFTVVGSADKNTGTYSRNIELSYQRAEYIRQQLIKLGIKEENVHIKIAEPGTLYENDKQNRVVIVD